MASLRTSVGSRTWCHVRIGQEYIKVDCNVRYLHCIRKYLYAAFMDMIYKEQNVFIGCISVDSMPSEYL